MPTHVGPCPEAEWEIWYRDTFDRDCPASIDLRGRGLLQGLAQLWARHLFETVQVDGSFGFSRFHLWWKERRLSVQIPGEVEGAARLRRWMFGAKRHTSKGYVAEAEPCLLGAVAEAHAGLLLAGKNGDPILRAAQAAADLHDFQQRLSALASRRSR